MSKASDSEFGLMLQAPDAYGAHGKGLMRALSAGVPIERAAAICGLTTDELAGALRIVKQARRAGRRARAVALATARGTAKAHPVALAARGVRTGARGIAAATRAVRRRIFRAFFRKLIDRRARLVSWQGRRSLQPNAAERQTARSWAVGYVKRRGLLGKLIGSALGGHSVGEPATSALVTASIPVLLEIARRALRAAEKEGAPRDPRDTPERAPDDEDAEGEGT